MPRRVVAHRADESFDLVEVPAPNEYHLQEIVRTHPQLIPAEDLGLGGDLLVVGRETMLASVAIDLLCLARSGDLVLVEFKTGPQNPDFRHALAQVVDYGSDLWRLSPADFDRGVVQRYLSKHHGAGTPPVTTLDEAISQSGWDLNDEERTALHSRLAEVLATGDFVFVVAAQRFTPAMVRTLEYLNTATRFGRYFLVEVVRLSGRDLTAHAAQVVAGPPARATTSSGAASQANETDFLAAIPGLEYRDAMADILVACATLGLAVQWQSQGASIRIQTPDRPEPLSIGWVFLEGPHYKGARHLSLGVDPASLAKTPSVQAPVTAFIHRVKAITGATPVSTSLEAWMFLPAATPAAKQDILEALEDLVKAFQGDA